MKITNLEYIENKYNVELIKFRGKPVWPILRVYIGSKLMLNKKIIVFNMRNLLKFLLSFSRGFFNLFFTNSEYLAFTETNKRFFLNGKYYDRLLDPIAEELDMLVIETPLFTHYPRKTICTKKLSSSVPLIFMREIISFFILTKKIESEDLLITIFKELNISINYRKIIRRVFAEEILMRYFFKLKKIKGVFVVVSYTKPGIIMACKKLSIPVIELQHGVISKAHYAYNVTKKIDDTFYPNYLFTYGELEKCVFNEHNHFIKKENVFPVGNFLIDYYRSSFQNHSEFEEKTKGYDLTVSVTGQIAFDHLLAPFLLDLAKVNQNVAFIFIPRTDNYFLVNNLPIPQNLIFINTLNTYDIIRRSDFHATITSTCSIEALSMGVPNIFINLNDLSIKYYSNLKNYKYCYFINSVDEFNNIISNYTKIGRDLIIKEYHFLTVNNYKYNCLNAINKIFLN